MQFFIVEVHCQYHPRDFWYEGFDESGTLRWTGTEWTIRLEIENHIKPIDMVTTIYGKRVLHETFAEFQQSMKAVKESIEKDGS